MKEDNFKNDDLFVITNKSYIEKQELSTEEEQEKKDLNYLYQLTGQNLKLSNLKQDIGIFLELTNDLFNDIRVVSEAGKKIRNYQQNNINNNSKQKVNNESLYNNKVKCFNNKLELFNKKLSFIKEKNQNYKEVIDYLTKIKKYGFFLDEKFDIKVNDTILDLDKFIIHHKWLKNFEELINIKNKNFSLFDCGNGKYNLKSNFYEYYNNKYNLDFFFEIRMLTMKFYLSNDYFEKYIRDYNPLEIWDKSSIPPFKLELIIFYLKYLMYKFFKEEMNALRKQKKNESKETAFENNGFNFVINKYPDKISMKSYYFDIIEITFSISKYEKDEFIKPKNNKSYCCYDSHSKQGQEIIEIPDKTNNPIVHSVMKFVDICLNNFLFNIKCSTNINSFLAEVKKNNNLTLDNIIKNSIFIKNITTLGLILLKNHLKSTIKRLSDKKFIFSHSVNIHETALGKYSIYWEFFEKGMRFYNSIELSFDNNLNLTIDAKEPYRNIIYSIDQGKYISDEKGRISFNYLFEILNSIIGNK